MARSISAWRLWGPQRRSKPRTQATTPATAPEPVSVDLSAVQGTPDDYAAAAQAATEQAHALAAKLAPRTTEPDPRIHYRRPDTTGPTTACGKYAALTWLTTTPPDVGCRSCKRTLIYRHTTQP